MSTFLGTPGYGPADGSEHQAQRAAGYAAADRPDGALTDPAVLARLERDAKEILDRYPRPRSALLPLLHLVQAEEGFVSPQGIEFCARTLGVSTAEVAGVATFYTQYKRRPVGDYAVGVCTNTLCAVLGGDAVYAALKAHLGLDSAGDAGGAGSDETTPDGKVTLEHLECNAACDYAPVVLVNWEFFDNQTPESAVALVDALRRGEPPTPTRGAGLRTFRETSRVLAGFYDGRADEGPGAGPATLAGLRLAREREEAGRPGGSAARGGEGRDAPVEEIAATGSIGYGAAGGPSGADSGVQTAASDAANPAGVHDTQNNTSQSGPSTPQTQHVQQKGTSP